MREEKVVGSLNRYRDAAVEHLAWCVQHGLPPRGGAWSLEDPISGLLLSSIVSPNSSTTVLNSLCGEEWPSVEVEEVWWPSSLVDIIVNFRVDDKVHMLALEHKHVNSPSNAPGYKRSGGGKLWQTEFFARQVDRALRDQNHTLLGGPFRLEDRDELHLVVLDARGREMMQFGVDAWDEPHEHERWDIISYDLFARRMRRSYEVEKQPGLEPLLMQMFASENT